MHQKTDGDKTVFITGLALVLAIVILGMLFPQALGTIGGKAMSFLTGGFGWLYNAGAFIFVIFCLGVGMSRFGSIKAG